MNLGLPLENTRAKVVRLTDQKEFLGWVCGERDKRFVFTTDTTDPISVGDPFFCEFFLYQWTLKTIGVVNAVSARLGPDGVQIGVAVGMEQTQTVSVERSGGEERFRVREIYAVVSNENGFGGRKCEVLDVSAQGLAVRSMNGYAIGTRCQISVGEAPNVIHFHAIVRYSQEADSGYRVGFQVEKMDRIPRGRWNRLLRDINTLGSARAA